MHLYHLPTAFAIGWQVSCDPSLLMTCNIYSQNKVTADDSDKFAHK